MDGAPLSQYGWCASIAIWMVHLYRNMDGAPLSQYGWCASIAIWMVRLYRNMDGAPLSQYGWCASIAIWMVHLYRNMDGAPLSQYEWCTSIVWVIYSSTVPFVIREHCKKGKIRDDHVELEHCCCCCLLLLLLLAKPKHFVFFFAPGWSVNVTEFWLKPGRCRGFNIFLFSHQLVLVKYANSPWPKTLTPLFGLLGLLDRLDRDASCGRGLPLCLLRLLAEGNLYHTYHAYLVQILHRMV